MVIRKVVTNWFKCAHRAFLQRKGSFPMPRSNRNELLIVLKKYQGENNHLSEEILTGISHTFNLPNNEVYGVSSFYSFLSTKPQGKYVIRICKSLPCHLKDAQMIIRCIKKRLGISPGEVSKDGKFSFELTNCLGACDLAPAMLINHDVHGHLTPEKISKILKEYN